MRFKAWLGIGCAVLASGGTGCGGEDAAPVCGDGRVEGFEQCDDGNDDDLDGCTTECLEWSPPAGEPITVEADHTWEWVPVEGAVCRNGDPTGFAVNFDSSSSRVMIYLEGGGACFENFTCGTNPRTFDPEEWGGRSGGIFDRTHPDNPVADWNFVYVPYCTGDVHAGLAEDVEVPGVDGLQQFVGYRNVGLFLERIVPTFPDAEVVLLTGVSAGGFGAAANAEQVQRDFGSTPVVLLDDSGPPMSSEFIRPCLQAQWRELWGLERTMLADCQWDCPDPDDFVLDLAAHIAGAHPENAGGLFSHRQDSVIRLFYGFGREECGASIPGTMPAEDFERGLADFRGFMQDRADNFGTYHIEGESHTCIGGGCFYDTDEAGVPLTDWVADLIDGQVAHVGP
ncbi:MAG: pectin acetylesterase-family hydrolase, partial [Myxococcota bacterium]